MQGRRTDENTQMNVLKLYGEGLSFEKIANATGIHPSTCLRIVNRFEQNKTFGEPVRFGRKPCKSTPAVVEFVEFCKFSKPSKYSREIRKDLLDKNVCDLNDVPSRRTVSRIVQETLGMSRKVLQSNPVEVANQDALFDAYLSQTIDYDPRKLHFFDEASVIKTSGNRAYGHAPVGSRAIEFQKYASNATYTVNLSCGFYGIDYFNILEGPSNAFEMLFFFQEAIEETNVLGNPVYDHGDLIIMDNCGFHHHRLVSRLLRNILRRQGVQIVFQPPYSPELNVAEYIFHLMRNNLKDKTDFVYEYTELSIVEALQEIPSGVFRRLY